MLRFLLITVLVLYVVSKIAGYFFRAGASSRFRPQQPDGKAPNDAGSRKGPKTGNFKGGEYVDYEEVK